MEAKESRISRKGPLVTTGACRHEREKGVDGGRNESEENFKLAKGPTAPCSGLVKAAICIHFKCPHLSEDKKKTQIRSVVIRLGYR